MAAPTNDDGTAANINGTAVADVAAEGTSVAVQPTSDSVRAAVQIASFDAPDT